MHKCEYCIGSGTVGFGLSNSLNVTVPCPVCNGNGELHSPYPKNDVVYVVQTETEVLMAKWNRVYFVEFNPFGEQPKNPQKIPATELVGWG